MVDSWKVETSVQLPSLREKRSVLAHSVWINQSVIAV